LGQYIGGGAFGSVYVGINLDTSELMAVKEIRFPAQPTKLSGEGSKIVREMQVMSMLQHPNIVTYYGIEVHREKVYLFMELCTRGSLAKLIQEQGRVDEVTARLFVVQMLRGLRYLHASGICHRDIKCDNTLLDDSMTIKLVDFGAAKVLNRQSLAMRTRRGRDGATLTGTPMYMAPEVITGPAAERPEPGALGAQDIWSLGCCIVEMLTGSAPWAHLDNEWAIMYHVVADSPPLPDASLVGSDGLDFLQKCFTRAPSKRPTAEELLKHKWVWRGAGAAGAS
ncbi:kinase-like protein, partial [Linderina pennispora]